MSREAGAPALTRRVVACGCWLLGAGLLGQDVLGTPQTSLVVAETAIPVAQIAEVGTYKAPAMEKA